MIRKYELALGGHESICDRHAREVYGATRKEVEERPQAKGPCACCRRDKRLFEAEERVAVTVHWNLTKAGIIS